MYDSEFIKAARRSWNDLVTDVADVCKALDTTDDYETARERAADVLAEPLEVTQETLNAYHILLGTGGPARGLDIYATARGEIKHAAFWYQDWFQAKFYIPMTTEQAEDIVRAYDLYIGD